MSATVGTRGKAVHATLGTGVTRCGSEYAYARDGKPPASLHYTDGKVTCQKCIHLAAKDASEEPASTVDCVQVGKRGVQAHARKGTGTVCGQENGRGTRNGAPQSDLIPVKGPVTCELCIRHGKLEAPVKTVATVNTLTIRKPKEKVSVPAESNHKSRVVPDSIDRALDNFRAMRDSVQSESGRKFWSTRIDSLTA